MISLARITNANDNGMMQAVKNCSNPSGLAQRPNGKERCCFYPPRQRRISGALLFVVAIWMVELSLLLKDNYCSGFVPSRLSSSVPPSVSSAHHGQVGESRQSWQNRIHHLSAASTIITTDASKSISSILADDEKSETGGRSLAKYFTQSTSFSMELPTIAESRRRKAWNFLKKKVLFWRNTTGETGDATTTSTTLDFEYSYDVIELSGEATSTSASPTTGILLIHPIGVGIARWFYQRLVSSLVKRYETTREDLVIVVPDLLGSGSACNATVGTETARKFPMFNISDWTNQLDELMVTTEAARKIDRWCVVANGGCSPIALQLAQRKTCTTPEQDASGVSVSNLVLSSVPRLPFFLKNETTNDPAKVAKSYRTLSGITGNLFWWYACRKEGAFIQTFSEKNLIADPKNLGPTWRSNCYETAVSFEGKGKYATFSFLAGTLQDGCVPSLEAVKDTSLKIDIIKGADVRRNRAKSWFWQKPKKGQKDEKDAQNTNNGKGESDDASGSTDSTHTNATDAPSNKSYETFRDYAEKNGNGGRELIIGGRISLAHEDSDGYADAILQFLMD